MDETLRQLLTLGKEYYVKRDFPKICEGKGSDQAVALVGNDEISGWQTAHHPLNAAGPAPGDH